MSHCATSVSSTSSVFKPRPLTIALAKGRLLDEALRRLARVGIEVAAEELDSRKLVVTDRTGAYEFLLVKPADVPVYVEYGVASAGVCGYDVLVESAADVLEPLALGYGRCKLALAARAGDAAARFDTVATLRIATKYPRTTAEYFQERGVPVEIVVLQGSVEIAPRLGLAERIVDLVETGQTLRENGLVVCETILEVSARLIVNRAAYQLERAAIGDLIHCFSTAEKAANG